MRAISDTPVVSIITIFLDEERFIGEAVESVSAQTYRDWELLLLDDGSTDGSTEIARRFTEQHPGWIRYLDHPGHANRGMSATRNLGLAHARGPFLAFLDADDVWLPSKLAEQVPTARERAGNRDAVLLDGVLAQLDRSARGSRYPLPAGPRRGGVRSAEFADALSGRPVPDALHG
jgi:glycosyltransferase involved in cell wall biosynthesis